MQLALVRRKNPETFLLICFTVSANTHKFAHFLNFSSGFIPLSHWLRVFSLSPALAIAIFSLILATVFARCFGLRSSRLNLSLPAL